MAPQPIPPEKVKTPTGIGINETDGNARDSEKPARSRRVLRRFVTRGGQLVEVEKVHRETR